MPVDAQPADELERRLREALEQRVNQRQRPPGFLEFRFLPLQPFLAALEFGGVFHALLLVPVLQEQQQVMHDGHKVRLPLLVVVVAQDFFSASLVFVSSNTFSISHRVL